MSELAKRFCVSLGWALKISSQLYRTGKMERVAGRRRGPVSKITAEIEQELKDWIAKQSDLTLAELQLRLFEKRQLEISLSRLWTVRKGLGLRLKKSRSTPPNKIPKRGVFGARTGGRSVNRSTRRA